MGGYTHVSVLDVEDSAEKFGFGDTHESRFAHGALEAEATGFSLHRFKPGSGSRSATAMTRRGGDLLRRLGLRPGQARRRHSGAASEGGGAGRSGRDAAVRGGRRGTRDPRVRAAARRGPRRGRPGLVELDHRQLGVDLYNDAWRLLEKERTPEEDASCFIRRTPRPTTGSRRRSANRRTGRAASGSVRGPTQ